MTQFDYDLFVIGGGSGGVRAARIAAAKGAARQAGRGKPHGRHLRHPGLCAEKDHGQCLRAFRIWCRMPAPMAGMRGSASLTGRVFVVSWRQNWTGWKRPIAAR